MDKEKEQTLREELRSVFNDNSEKTPPSWRDLQKLPYLASVVKEGLRFGPLEHSLTHSPTLILYKY